jgi:hypothetical protein
MQVPFQRNQAGNLAFTSEIRYIMKRYYIQFYNDVFSLQIFFVHSIIKMKGGNDKKKFTISIIRLYSSIVYTIISSEETGQVFVKRFKIKNWDRVKRKS